MDNEYYKIYASIITHVGKIRNNNEDNYYFCGHILDNSEKEKDLKNEAHTKEPIVFGVFDGMGGHEYGERASYILADTTKFTQLNECLLEDSLLEICDKANTLVCEEMRECKVRIGSTASFIALHNTYAYVCNIGDTPIYLYRNHQLQEIYEEHTEKRMYERIYGYADPNKKYRLTQNIGIFKEEMLIKPYTDSFEIQNGDLLIICSDGLTDMVSKEEICSILDNSEKEDRGLMLTNAALDAGGRDNITILIIEIGKKKKRNIFDRF